VWKRRPPKPSTLIGYLSQIFEGVQNVAADLTALTTQLTQDKADADAAAARVSADLAGLRTQVTDLQAQIAALSAGTVTQAQIDALTASAQAIDTAVVAIDPAPAA